MEETYECMYAGIKSLGFAQHTFYMKQTSNCFGVATEGVWLDIRCDQSYVVRSSL